MCVGAPGHLGMALVLKGSFEKQDREGTRRHEMSFQVNPHIMVCFPRKEKNNYSAQLQIKIFYWHAIQYKHCQCVEKAETLGNCQQ